MVTSLIEALLASNGNIRSTSILGASRTNQSRIFAPGMHKDLSGRDDVGITVRNDVAKRIKSTLLLTDLRPMNGIRHLRELKNVLRKVSSAQASKSLTRAIR